MSDKIDPKLKATIDTMSYEALLSRWRFAPVGDPMFQGEAGDYYAKRMTAMRAEPGGQDRHVSASKGIGWTK